MLVDVDEDKRRRILAERGFDLRRAALILQGPVLISEDARHDYGEKRYIAIGTYDGEYFTLVYTPRKDQTSGEDIFRVITAWRTGGRARHRYQNLFPR